MNPSKDDTKKYQKKERRNTEVGLHNARLSFYLLEATAIPPPGMCWSLLVRLSRPPQALQYYIGSAFKGIPSCLGLLFERTIHLVGFHQGPTFISRPSDRYGCCIKDYTTLHCTAIRYLGIEISHFTGHSHSLSFYMYTPCLIVLPQLPVLCIVGSVPHAYALL